MNRSLKKEVIRKSVHMTSVLIPIFYMLTDFSTSIIIFIIILNLCLIFDLLRLRVLKDSSIFKNLINITGISSIFREHENERISGASYLLLGAVICITFVPKIIFVMAFFILAVADSAAALIGKTYGKYKIREKTLEGTCAFFIASIFAVFPTAILYNNTNLQFIAVLLVSIIITTFAELYLASRMLDDNLIIPLTFCISYSIMSSFIEVGNLHLN